MSRSSAGVGQFAPLQQIDAHGDDRLVLATAYQHGGLEAGQLAFHIDLQGLEQASTAPPVTMVPVVSAWLPDICRFDGSGRVGICTSRYSGACC